MILLFFIYGLSFFALGMALLTRPYPRSIVLLRPSLNALGAFAIVHSMTEWSIMWGLTAPSPEVALFAANLAVSTTGLSFIILGYGAVEALRRLHGTIYLPLLVWGFFAVCLWLATLTSTFVAASDGVVPDITSRWAIGGPSALGLAYVFYRFSDDFRGMFDTALERRTRIWLLASGVCLGLYGLSTFFGKTADAFPFSIINSENIASITGIQVAAFRTIITIGLLLCVLKFLQTLTDIENAEIESTIADRTYALETANENLRQVAREAAEANSAKSAFLASMSHELRTPLNAVLGYGQMLELNLENSLSASQKEYTGLILQGGNHLLNLVNDILDLAVVEADKVVVFPEAFDPLDTVQNAYEDLKLSAKDARVSIRLESLPDSQIEIFSDVTRYRQIITNLLTNAIKYNRKDGSVAIYGSILEDQYFRVSFVDTGIGIPKDKQDQVFDMFNRGNADPTVAANGLGIGLSVSKMLTDRLGGRIGFVSEEGAGSTFWIDMPLASNDAVLVWSDRLRVGIDPIDADHQRIFELTNAASRANVNEEDMALIIQEMVAYTHSHFRREEAIMEVCGYPSIESHKIKHTKLEQHLDRLMRDWERDTKTETLLELRKFLRAWWSHHILDVDTDLKKHAEGHETAIADALMMIERFVPKTNPP